MINNYFINIHLQDIQFGDKSLRHEEEYILSNLKSSAQDNENLKKLQIYIFFVTSSEVYYEAMSNNG